MAAPEKPQAEKPMSPPREHGLPLESESMRILQQAVAAAEQAMTGAEQITARASRLESAIGAVARNYQALIATRERAVAEAQEQASHAIAASEASLSRIGQAAPPVRAGPDVAGDVPPMPQHAAAQTDAAAAAQQRADQSIAATEEAVSAVSKIKQAPITDEAMCGPLPLDDGFVAQAVRQSSESQRLAIEAAQLQADRAIAAAVAGTVGGTPPASAHD